MSIEDRHPKSPESRTMTEGETVVFLQEKGIQLLDINEWKKHPHPVLLVFEEVLRADDNRALNYFPRNQRPNIARIDAPVEIYLPPLPERDPKNINHYALKNNGGQIDYYAIDPVTKEVALVKTSANERMKIPYYVLPSGLYMPSDDLFPKSKPPHIA